MTLTKLKSVVSGEFEYVNMENVTHIDTSDDKYELYFSGGYTIALDLTETKIATYLTGVV